jgi:hypothetical protein
MFSELTSTENVLHHRQSQHLDTADSHRLPSSSGTRQTAPLFSPGIHFHMELDCFAARSEMTNGPLVNVRAWPSGVVAFDECNPVANRFLGGIFCGRQGITIEIPVLAESLLKAEGGPTSLNEGRPRCYGIVEILPSWAQWVWPPGTRR